jgi:hypothetical protein
MSLPFLYVVTGEPSTRLAAARIGPLDREHVQRVAHTLVSQGYTEVSIKLDESEGDATSTKAAAPTDPPGLISSTLASTQFAGSGLTINQYGVDLSNPASMTEATSWAVRVCQYPR